MQKKNPDSDRIIITQDRAVASLPACACSKAKSSPPPVVHAQGENPLLLGSRRRRGRKVIRILNP